MKKVMLSWLVLSLAVSTVVYADDSLEFEITADFFSKYIWRGQNLDDDYVFQPGVSVAFGDITAGIWASTELTDINKNNGEITEIDYYIDYSIDIPGLEGVSFSGGVINYHFPGISGDTTELYYGFSLDLPLSPSITIYEDIDQIDGTYVSFALSHAVEEIATLSDGSSIAMEIGASLGYGDTAYNKGYWGLADGEMNDLALSLSFPMEIAGWTFAPSINYVALMSDDISRTDKFSRESDYFFTGLSLSKSF